jgi:hypothetical protein
MLLKDINLEYEKLSNNEIEWMICLCYLEREFNFILPDYYWSFMIPTENQIRYCLTKDYTKTSDPKIFKLNLYHLAGRIGWYKTEMDKLFIKFWRKETQKVIFIHKRGRGNKRKIQRIKSDKMKNKFSAKKWEMLKK